MLTSLSYQVIGLDVRLDAIVSMFDGVFPFLLQKERSSIIPI